mmetsp:Transcript_21079/g.45673  ORF Transcript_21079/g.45673 Transcript_21079/m.45673 type:complete len:207 (+) Transcript_21079:1419-2039(+)
MSTKRSAPRCRRIDPFDVNFDTPPRSVLICKCGGALCTSRRKDSTTCFTKMFGTTAFIDASTLSVKSFDLRRIFLDSARNLVADALDRNDNCREDVLVLPGTASLFSSDAQESASSSSKRLASLQSLIELVLRKLHSLGCPFVSTSTLLIGSGRDRSTVSTLLTISSVQSFPIFIHIALLLTAKGVNLCSSKNAPHASIRTASGIR